MRFADMAGTPAGVTVKDRLESAYRSVQTVFDTMGTGFGALTEDDLERLHTLLTRAQVSLADAGDIMSKTAQEADI